MKNKVKSLLSITLALALLLAAIAGCAAPEETTVAETSSAPETTPTQETTPVTEPALESVTIIDATGREVTIPLPVETICYTHPSIAEGLRVMGAWDRVVNRDAYTTDTIVYPNLDDLPVISPATDSYDLDYEKVFELDPDVFITVYTPAVTGTGPDEEIAQIAARLEPDIPVVALCLFDLNTFSNDIASLGSILGEEQRASDIASWFEGIKSSIMDVTSRLAEEDKPTMLFKTGWGTPEDIQTFTDEARYAQLWQSAGAVNVAAGLESAGGYVSAIDPEWLITADPEFVICSEADTGRLGSDIDDDAVARDHREAVMASPAFFDGTAVRNGDVYLLNIYLSGSPRIAIMMAYMAKWFHPDLFEDMDPKALHQEYIDRFLEIDFDLDEHGLFVYPEN